MNEDNIEYYELDFSVPVHTVSCHVCDNDVRIMGDIALIDHFGQFCGWECPVCESLYNRRDEIVQLGDLGGIEHGQA